MPALFRPVDRRERDGELNAAHAPTVPLPTARSPAGPGRLTVLLVLVSACVGPYPQHTVKHDDIENRTSHDATYIQTQCQCQPPAPISIPFSRPVLTSRRKTRELILYPIGEDPFSNQNAHRLDQGRTARHSLPTLSKPQVCRLWSQGCSRCLAAVSSRSWPGNPT